MIVNSEDSNAGLFVRMLLFCFPLSKKIIILGGVLLSPQTIQYSIVMLKNDILKTVIYQKLIRQQC